jgi:hypothetical protein
MSPGAEQASSLQVLPESPNDQDLAGRNGEGRGNADSSSAVTCFSCLPTSHVASSVVNFSRITS